MRDQLEGAIGLAEKMSKNVSNASNGFSLIRSNAVCSAGKMTPTKW